MKWTDTSTVVISIFAICISAYTIHMNAMTEQRRSLTNFYQSVLAGATEDIRKCHQGEKQ